jgi:hypothetical protein
MQAAQTRVAQHQQFRANQMQAQNRMAQRQQVRNDRLQAAQNRVAQRQQMQANRIAQVQNNMAQRQQMQANRMQRIQQANNAFPGRYGNMNVNPNTQGANGFGIGGCPPGLASKGCMPPGQAANLARTNGFISPVITADNAPLLRNAWQGARVDELNTRYGTQIIAPALATSLIGLPIANAPSILGMGLSPLPQPISYLYPSTPNYYYDYAPGYVYQVDQGSNLINALIPLLAGGFMPGSYLPQPMMSSYVPDYYGLNSFYPASYGYGGYGGYGSPYDSAYGSPYGYGNGFADPYGYANTCNRYEYGVVYQVDCMTGMVENVIPVYNNGYGVGQMLPSAYTYYNVPDQYRSIYYDTADSNYWYAPGAIYQYDPRSSLITSVAALLGPGMTIGQQLPMGYDTYNVPYTYRSTYYDTPDAWYRYSNGNIYQINPVTQLVTAIVASVLT